MPWSTLPRLGSGIGLHRTLELSAGLVDDPWFRDLDAIKVTGSNGKGSVATMTAAILTAAGVRTGLFTSPHLFDIRERIAVDGSPVAVADFRRLTSWLELELERWQEGHPDERVSRFEALTVVALEHFRRARPEALVVEAGVGGRFDPTRIVPGQLTALVSLDLEHTALLGTCLEEIAYDKADLAADGTTLVTGELPEEISRRLAAYARLRHLEQVAAERWIRRRRTAWTASGMELDLEAPGERWDGVHLALFGEHQAANAALAAGLARCWLARHRPGVDPEPAVRRGLAGVSCPCRLERIHADPEVVVDTAHTPAAVDALVAAVRRLWQGRRILLVVGVSRDRDLPALVARLAPLAATAIATRAHHHGADPAAVAAELRRHGVEVTVESAIDVALPVAVERAARRGMAVLVAGGLFLAAEAAAASRGIDPRSLRF